MKKTRKILSYGIVMFSIIFSTMGKYLESIDLLLFVIAMNSIDSATDEA